MRLLAASVIAVGLITCSQNVRLNESAEKIEFLSHEYSGQHGYKCEKVADLSASSIPAEVSSERDLSVVEVKLMNEARRRGATHLLRWPSREWPCDKDGTDNPESERRCVEMDATAYTCLVGRGT